jgi:hypothetical protein
MRMVYRAVMTRHSALPQQIDATKQISKEESPAGVRLPANMDREKSHYNEKLSQKPTY